MKKVVHLCSGLGKGGAETMLFNLLRYKDNSELQYSVISFGLSNYYENEIKKLGIELIEINLKKHPIKALFKSIKFIRDFDVLCCWLYHCNFIGYYIAKIAGTKKVLWNIRHSNLDPQFNKRLTLWINKFCSKKSENVDKILYNGVKAKSVHESIGYDKEKSVILNNGCDTEEFKFKEKARASIISEIGINQNKKIILSVSKYHAIKDIPTFIRTFSEMYRNDCESVAIMCGLRIDENNKDLCELIKDNGLFINENIFLLGLRDDIPELMSACDLFILHSAGEAFPNTLIQAMSCSALVISTDVGDAIKIIGDENFIVDVGDYNDLAKKSNYLLNSSLTEKMKIKKKNREIVVNNYDIKKIVKTYENIFLV